MPGAMMQGDILNRLAIPPDQQMAGDAKCGNFGKIGVLFALESKPPGCSLNTSISPVAF